MNLVEIVLTTEYTSVPPHCKIYCCDELIYNNIVDKNTAIKHFFNTPKQFKIKIIKSGKTKKTINQKLQQKIKIEKINVNGIDLKIKAFGYFKTKDNLYVNDHTLQTNELDLNGEWTISLIPQVLVGFFNSQNVDIRDSIDDCDVACFGCSQTYGLFLKKNQTWPYQLSKILNMKVKNFGIPGSNINEITAFVENYLKKYNTKMILILLPHSFRRQLVVNSKIKNISPHSKDNKELIFHGEEHSIANLSLSMINWLKNIDKKIFISSYHLSEYNLIKKTPLKNYVMPFLDSQHYPKAKDNIHFGEEYCKDYAELLANFMKEKGLI